MLVLMVNAHVKSGFIDEFIHATRDNAQNSNLEPGIARFDFYQQSDDPTRFVLLEIYRSDDAPAKHRETPHYQRWRTAVDSMMEVPRTRVEYRILYPQIEES